VPITLGVPELHELLENPRSSAFGDPGPLIPHLDRARRGVAAHREQHAPAPRVPHGVHRQVVHHAGQEPGIREGRRRAAAGEITVVAVPAPIVIGPLLDDAVAALRDETESRDMLHDVGAWTVRATAGTYRISLRLTAMFALFGVILVVWRALANAWKHRPWGDGPPARVIAWAVSVQGIAWLAWLALSVLRTGAFPGAIERVLATRW
jgi:hypothetical protein